ncbi:11643_t:CDS:2 [Racocetra fulgida]|uniref:11643_t:CDS:1 n=1 Tax=Racocetra fulgida TaxID=60492 RepID=A0A9N8Z9Z9_9GLOM|nr:11643_t:CDS:2 [Racocetra fulgida]
MYKSFCINIIRIELAKTREEHVEVDFNAFNTYLNKAPNKDSLKNPIYTQ